MSLSSFRAVSEGPEWPSFPLEDQIDILSGAFTEEIEKAPDEETKTALYKDFAESRKVLASNRVKDRLGDKAPLHTAAFLEFARTEDKLFNEAKGASAKDGTPTLPDFDPALAIRQVEAVEVLTGKTLGGRALREEFVNKGPDAIAPDRIRKTLADPAFLQARESVRNENKDLDSFFNYAAAGESTDFQPWGKDDKNPDGIVQIRKKPIPGPAYEVKFPNGQIEEMRFGREVGDLRPFNAGEKAVMGIGVVGTLFGQRVSDLFASPDEQQRKLDAGETGRTPEQQKELDRFQGSAFDTSTSEEPFGALDVHVPSNNQLLKFVGTRVDKLSDAQRKDFEEKRGSFTISDLRANAISAPIRGSVVQALEGIAGTVDLARRSVGGSEDSLVADFSRGGREAGSLIRRNLAPSKADAGVVSQSLASIIESGSGLVADMLVAKGVGRIGKVQGLTEAGVAEASKAGFTLSASSKQIGGTYNDAFASHRARGMSLEQAHDLAAKEAETVGLFTAVIERAGAAEFFLTPRQAKSVADVVRSGFKGGLVESIGEETPQAFVETALQDLFRNDGSANTEIENLRKALGRGNLEAFKSSNIIQSTIGGFGAGAAVASVQGAAGLKVDKQPSAPVNTSDLTDEEVKKAADRALVQSSLADEATSEGESRRAALASVPDTLAPEAPAKSTPDLTTPEVKLAADAALPTPTPTDESNKQQPDPLAPTDEPSPGSVGNVDIEVTPAAKMRSSLGDPRPGFDTQVELPKGTRVELSDNDAGGVTATFETPKGKRGEGAATEAVTKLVEVARDQEVPVTLDVEPFGNERPMSREQLTGFYAKHGFELQPDGKTMIFDPKAEPGIASQDPVEPNATLAEPPQPTPTPKTDGNQSSEARRELPPSLVADQKPESSAPEKGANGKGQEEVLTPEPKPAPTVKPKATTKGQAEVSRTDTPEYKKQERFADVADEESLNFDDAAMLKRRADKALKAGYLTEDEHKSVMRMHASAIAEAKAEARKTKDDPEYDMTDAWDELKTSLRYGLEVAAGEPLAPKAEAPKAEAPKVSIDTKPAKPKRELTSKDLVNAQRIADTAVRGRGRNDQARESALNAVVDRLVEDPDTPIALLTTIAKRAAGTRGVLTAEREKRAAGEIGTLDTGIAESKEDTGRMRPDESLMQREEIEKAIKTLSATEQAAIRGSVEGRSNEEIAKELGTTPGTIANAKSRGREKLRKLLSEPSDSAVPFHENTAPKPSVEERSMTDQQIVDKFSPLLAASTGRTLAEVQANLKVSERSLTKAQQAAKGIAAFFGRRVVFVTGVRVNGMFHPSMPGTVLLSDNGSRSEVLVVFHELLHSLAATDPAAYQKLKDTVKVDLDSYVKKFKTRKNASLDVTHEEFLADFLADRATDPDFWEGMAAKDRGVFTKVVDLFRSIWKSVKSGRFGTEQFVSNMEQADAAVKDALTVLRTQGAVKPGEGGVKNENRFELTEDDARFAELTADLDPNDIEGWKATHEAEYQELTAMRERVLRGAGYDVGPVYHGTPNGEFTEFDTSNQGATGTVAKAFWFTENRKMAENFSDLAPTKGDKAAPVIMETFLKLGDKASTSDFKDIPAARIGLAHSRRASVIARAKRERRSSVKFTNMFDFGGPATVYAVFDPTQIKSADPLALDASGKLIPPSQWGDAGNPDIRFEIPEVEPGFYSQLERFVDDKVSNNGTPEQILATIGNNAKAEEIKWSGLKQALERIAAANGGKVPKAELQAYLRDEGRVGFVEAVEGVPRYAQYVLPGGNNYREVVLAMPNEEATYEIYRSDNGKLLKTVTASDLKVEMDRVRKLQEMADNDPAIVQSRPTGQTREGRSTYTSSRHFPDVPNYVAHMRLTERMDASGAPGLFIEEFQSDRHQEGRKKGYKEDFSQEEIDAVNKRAGDLTDARIKRARAFRLENGYPEELTDLLKLGRETKERYDREIAKDAEHQRLKAEATAARQRAAELSSDVIGLPADAPFRKDWPLALFKRALRDAVAGGKEWIGWTVGETQNDRFDLSKQVKRVSLYSPSYSEDKGWGNTWHVGADGMDGIGILQQSIARPEDAEEFVGKEVTARLIEKIKSGDGYSASLSGDGLKIGGSGMKGFYDNILPKEIGKYVKQWGGKVEQTSILTDKDKINRDPRITQLVGDTPGFVVEQQKDLRDVFYVRNLNTGKVVLLSDDNPDITEDDDDVQSFPSESAAQAWIDSKDTGRKSTPIHRVTITPEIRIGVEVGQVLFERRERPVQTAGTDNLFFTRKPASTKLVEKTIKRSFNHESHPLDDAGVVRATRFLAKLTSPKYIRQLQQAAIRNGVDPKDAHTVSGMARGAVVAYAARLSESNYKAAETLVHKMYKLSSDLGFLFPEGVVNATTIGKALRSLRSYPGGSIVGLFNAEMQGRTDFVVAKQGKDVAATAKTVSDADVEGEAAEALADSIAMELDPAMKQRIADAEKQARDAWRRVALLLSKIHKASNSVRTELPEGEDAESLVNRFFRLANDDNASLEDIAAAFEDMIPSLEPELGDVERAAVRRARSVSKDASKTKENETGTTSTTNQVDIMGKRRIGLVTRAKNEVKSEQEALKNAFKELMVSGKSRVDFLESYVALGGTAEVGAELFDANTRIIQRQQERRMDAEQRQAAESAERRAENSQRRAQEFVDKVGDPSPESPRPTSDNETPAKVVSRFINPGSATQSLDDFESRLADFTDADGNPFFTEDQIQEISARADIARKDAVAARSARAQVRAESKIAERAKRASEKRKAAIDKAQEFVDSINDKVEPKRPTSDTDSPRKAVARFINPNNARVPEDAFARQLREFTNGMGEQFFTEDQIQEIIVRAETARLEAQAVKSLAAQNRAEDAIAKREVSQLRKASDLFSGKSSKDPANRSVRDIILEDFINNPERKIASQAERIEFAEEILREKTDLSESEIPGVARMIEVQFAKKLEEAKFAAARPLLRTLGGKNLTRTMIEKAVRLEVLDPSNDFVTSIAALSGWEGLTGAESLRLTRLQREIDMVGPLSRAGMTRIMEQARIIEAAPGIPPGVKDSVNAYIRGSIYSSIGSQFVGISVGIWESHMVLVTETAASIIRNKGDIARTMEELAVLNNGFFRGSLRGIREFGRAMKTGSTYLEQVQGGQEGQGKFEDKIFVDPLTRIYDDATKKLATAIADYRAGRSKAAGKVLWQQFRRWVIASGRFTFRTLGAVDAAWTKMNSSTVANIIAFRRARDMGLTKGNIESIMVAAQRQAEAHRAYLVNDVGLTNSNEIAIEIQDAMEGAFHQALTERGVEGLDTLLDEAASDFQDKIGTGETSKKTFIGQATRAVTSLIQTFPAPLAGIIPAVRTVGNVMDGLMWTAPVVGLYRAVRAHRMTTEERNEFFPNIKADWQFRRRQGMALVTNALTLGIVAMLKANEDEPDDDKWFWWTGAWPYLNTAEQARWKRNGWSENTLIVGGMRFQLDRGFGQTLLVPMTLGAMAYEATNGMDSKEVVADLAGLAETFIPGVSQGRDRFKSMESVYGFGSFAEQQTAMFVPFSALLKSARRMEDRIDPKNTEAHWYQHNPFFVDTSAPGVMTFKNVLGEPLAEDVNPWGWVKKVGSPIYFTMDIPGRDPVKRQISEDFLSRKYAGGEVTLTDFKEHLQKNNTPYSPALYARWKEERISNFVGLYSRKRSSIIQDANYQNEVGALWSKAGSHADRMLGIKR